MRFEVLDGLFCLLNRPVQFRCQRRSFAAVALEAEGYRCTIKKGVIVAKAEGFDIPDDCYPSLDNHFSDVAKIVFEANRDCDCDNCKHRHCDQPDGCSISGYAKSVVVEEFQLNDTEDDADRVMDFDLENAQVVLPATAAKNGKVTPPTPLHPDLIPTLRKAFAGLGPEDRPLGKLTKHASADGFKIDMARAKLPLLDKGRVADLHALRGTFSTMLQRSGTSRLETSRLMHHAHPNQTDNYTTTTSDEARAAINRLPPPPTLD